VTAPSPGYRRLAFWTGIATFVLILVGGVVRVSDSGLGCGPGGSGFHGWPFCNGDVVPGVDLNSVVEYTHRVVAATVTLLIFYLAVQAWRRYRANRPLVWGTTAAALVIVAQAVLGGATVEHELNEGLVAAHLGLAMALLALVIFVWRACQSSVISHQSSDRSLRALSVAAGLAVLCTIVAGGYMAGTQRFGRPDEHLTSGAHHACGTQFPACNDGFLPFGNSRLVDIHLTHRVFMYLATLLVVALVVMVLRTRPGSREVRSAWVLLALLGLQVLVGALNVWIPHEYEALIVTHLALGTLLWATAVALALELNGVPSPAEARRPAARPEAVTA
jgi:heme A synthase